jgi:hypothetical protein
VQRRGSHYCPSPAPGRLHPLSVCCCHLSQCNAAATAHRGPCNALPSSCPDFSPSGGGASRAMQCRRVTEPSVAVARPCHQQSTGTWRRCHPPRERQAARLALFLRQISLLGCRFPLVVALLGNDLDCQASATAGTGKHGQPARAHAGIHVGAPRRRPTPHISLARQSCPKQLKQRGWVQPTSTSCTRNLPSSQHGARAAPLHARWALAAWQLPVVIKDAGSQSQLANTSLRAAQQARGNPLHQGPPPGGLQGMQAAKGCAWSAQCRHATSACHVVYQGF